MVRDTMPPALLGRTPAMTGVYKQIAHAASADAPVLIIGESGTGKELVARAIHQHGNRSDRPFVPINCGALTETLLESELFGHVKGSFTGAVADTKGVFQTAHTGTVFLDEVGEMSPALQVKLLRVLQEGEVRPVGASRAVTVTCASSRRPTWTSSAGRRRQVPAGPLLPPRRRHHQAAAAARAARRHPAAGRALPPGRAIEERQAGGVHAGGGRALAAYHWPGNVRELENLIERLVVFSRGSRIDISDLPATVKPRAPVLEKRLFDDLPTLDEIERRYLLHVLEQVGHNRTRAAEVMGIDRRTLYRMAERFGVPLGEQPE